MGSIILELTELLDAFLMQNGAGRCNTEGERDAGPGPVLGPRSDPDLGAAKTTSEQPQAEAVARVAAVPHPGRDLAHQLQADHEGVQGTKVVMNFTKCLFCCKLFFILNAQLKA